MVEAYRGNIICPNKHVRTKKEEKKNDAETGSFFAVQLFDCDTVTVIVQCTCFSLVLSVKLW